MVTADDRKFCLQLSCENEVSSKRALYYMYIYQLFGFQIDFRYKVLSSGLGSSDFSAYLNEAIAFGIVTSKGGTLKNEQMSHTEVPLTRDIIDYLNEIRVVMDALTLDDLDLLCLADVLISKTIEKSSKSLGSEREHIESTLKHLCVAYSEDNFNYSLKFIRQVKAYGEECGLR